MTCKSKAHRSRWVVTERTANRSAFSGYRLTPSAYSEVRCLHADHQDPPVWRTKADYVPGLPDAAYLYRAGSLIPVHPDDI